MRKMLIAGFIGTVALAGCGGRGEGAGLQGYWQSDSDVVLITSRNELWGMGFDGFSIVAYKGSVTTDGDSFGMQGYKYVDGIRVAVAADGTFAERESITGETWLPEVANSSVPLSMTYLPEYDRAPTALTGTYSLYTRFARSTGNFTFKADGTVLGAIEGCGFSGSFAPDGSGKNFYRISLTFAEADCLLPGQTASGVVTGDAGNLARSIVITATDDSAALAGSFKKDLPD